MRGEHPGHSKMIVDGTGSPPHARGTPRHVPNNSIQNGITPACAGNTLIVSANSRNVSANFPFISYFLSYIVAI